MGMYHGSHVLQCKIRADPYRIEKLHVESLAFRVSALSVAHSPSVACGASSLSEGALGKIRIFIHRFKREARVDFDVRDGRRFRFPKSNASPTKSEKIASLSVDFLRFNLWIRAFSPTRHTSGALSRRGPWKKLHLHLPIFLWGFGVSRTVRFAKQNSRRSLQDWRKPSPN